MIAEVVIVALAVLVVAAIVWARVGLGQVGHEVSRDLRACPWSVGGGFQAHRVNRFPHPSPRGDGPRPMSAGALTARRGSTLRPQRRPHARPGQLASPRLPPAGEPKLRFSAPRQAGQLPPVHQEAAEDQESGAQQAAAARARTPLARSRYGRRRRGPRPWGGLPVVGRSASPGHGAPSRDRCRSSCGRRGGRGAAVSLSSGGSHPAGHDHDHRTGSGGHRPRPHHHHDDADDDSATHLGLYVQRRVHGALGELHLGLPGHGGLAGWG